LAGSVGEGGGGRAEESAGVVDGRMAVWLNGSGAVGAVGGCRAELKGEGREEEDDREDEDEVERGGRRLGGYEDAAGSHATSRDRGSLIN
jgi:hypothetical protein